MPLYTKQTRLYIGGLFPEVTESDIRQKFSKFGNVTNVDIRNKYDTETGELQKVFAYIEIEASESNLAKCFKVYSNTKWKGCEITIQIAKENFLQRLKEEREKQEIQKNVKKVSSFLDLNSASNQVNDISHGNTNLLPQSLTIKPCKKTSPKKTLMKFRGTKTAQLDIVNKDSDSSPDYVAENYSGNTIVRSTAKCQQNEAEKEQEPGSTKSKEEIVSVDSIRGNSLLKSKHIPGEKTDVNSSIADWSEKSLQDNQKRLQALRERQSQMKMQQLAIKKALQTKMVSRTKCDTERKKSSTTVQLFSSENESDEEIVPNNTSFKVKRQFEGEKGFKLMELQSRFKGDERFQIDERFLETEDKLKKDESEEKEGEPCRKIVETMFGSLEQARKKMQKRNAFKDVRRYDPTCEDAEKYQIKQEDTSRKMKKKKIQRNIPSPPKISSERYYEVSSALKNSLAVEENLEGFSLLKQFGIDEDSDTNSIVNTAKIEDEEEKKEEVKKSVFRANPFEINPFRFDSSDEEEQDSKNIIQFINPLAPARKTQSKTFFIQPNDVRLKDGLEFYRRESLEDIEKKWLQIKPNIFKCLKKRRKKANENARNKRKRDVFKIKRRFN